MAHLCWYLNTESHKKIVNCYNREACWLLSYRKLLKVIKSNKEKFKRTFLTNFHDLTHKIEKMPEITLGCFKEINYLKPNSDY